MSARIEQVDQPAVDTGEGYADFHTWLIGDDEHVIVIDPGRDAAAVLAAIGEREVLAVICTHGDADHATAAVEVGDEAGAGIAVHGDDWTAWHTVHGGEEPDIIVEDGGVFEVAGVRIEVMHTPGHTPGGISLHVPALDSVLTGDTLRANGPGPAVGPGADTARMLASIGERILDLPPATHVLPSRGPKGTVRAAVRDFDGWVAGGS